MISVIVEREPGNLQGPDISDSLITSDIAAIERGRNEIDKECSNREQVTTSGVYTQFIVPGKLLEVADAEALTWRGKVLASSISITCTQDNFDIVTSITSERTAE